VPIPSFIGREMADIMAYVRRESHLADRDVVLLEAPSPGAGERLFTTKGCVSCHGTDGRGTTSGPDLHDVTSRRRVSEIAGVLWNHSLQMYAAMEARGLELPRFSGTELADMIAFLYYLPFGESDGDRLRGEQVFREKRCVDCHDQTSAAPIGPDLSQSQALASSVSLATAMWNHAPAMFDVTQSRRVEWPRFEGNEMPDLLAYLRTLGGRR
jgi:cytochrome c2